MELINSWKAKTKQWDKFAIKLRLGRITILDIYGDISRKHFGISIFNLGVKAEKQPLKNDKNEKGIYQVNSKTGKGSKQSY